LNFNYHPYKTPYLIIFVIALFLAISFLFISGGLLSSNLDEYTLETSESVTENYTAISRTELESRMDGITTPLADIGPINSLLVSQHGDMVVEKYYGSMNANRGNNIKSASKSLLSILIGIAIDKGYLEGVDQPIGEFFPDYFDSNPDPIKASITIEDLLTMRSGLASTSRSNYGRWVTSNNWIHYKLNQPLRGVPGEDRIYSTGNTHLLAVILARATEMNTLQFAIRYLFGPMDIEITGWDRDPQGYFLGGNNMAMRPRDMVKMGQLMMNVGVYNGEQLVPKEWVIKSIEPVTGRIPGVENYGYLWFRRMSGNVHMIYAFGNGGQYIMIMPELDAVLTVTTRSGTGEPTRNYRRQLFTIIDQDIVPLLQAGYRDV